MKLARLHLRDFQAHADREVLLAPGVTTVMGPTDVGKSAILRALRWICLNDFAGGDFVRQGAKRAEVLLEVAEGGRTWTVRRVKGGGVNTYHLDDREFRAFGTGVPQDIEKLLSLSSLNFQDQHDPPFWFHETAGEVSRRLNALVDLSLMDEALGYVGGQIRRLQEQQDWQAERIAQLEESIKPYAELDQRVADFRGLQDLLSQWQRLHERQRRLSFLLEELDRLSTEGHPHKRKAQEGQALLEQVEVWRGKLQRLQALRTLCEEAQKRQRELAHPPPKLDALEMLYRQWQKAAERHERLWNLQAKLLLARDMLRQAEAKFHAAEEALKAVRGQPCPVCGQPLP